MSNPYTLVFGQPPLEMVERTAQAERIISEFCRQNPSNYINLVTGIRGSGKTVFITSVAEKIGEKEDWIVINLNPQRDLLMSLAAKLDSNQMLHNIFYHAKINLQAFAFQTIGYFFWENPEDREKAADDSKEYLFEFAYWKIWSELSSVDKKVVKAVSEVPTGEISLIRGRLSWSSNQFNPYRRRLLNAGVITSPENGRVELALPWFGEFAQQAG